MLILLPTIQCREIYQNKHLCQIIEILHTIQSFRITQQHQILIEYCHLCLPNFRLRITLLSKLRIHFLTTPKSLTPSCLQIFQLRECKCKMTKVNQNYLIFQTLDFLLTHPIYKILQLIYSQLSLQLHHALEISSY